MACDTKREEWICDFEEDTRANGEKVLCCANRQTRRHREEGQGIYHTSSLWKHERLRPAWLDLGETAMFPKAKARQHTAA